MVVGKLMHINSHTKKVLDFLRSNANHPYNAKTIDRAIYGKKDYKNDKKRMGTIKTILSRLAKNGTIRRVSRGFYQANINTSMLHQLENPPTLLHGIMLDCRTTEKLQKCIHGIPSKEYTDEALELFFALGFVSTTNYRYHNDLWYEGRKITITVHLKGKIDVYINSSNNPIDYPGFLKILAFLDGYLVNLAPFRDRKVVRLLEIGVAKDFKQLRLEGAQCISLKAFTNAWARVYYKKDINATRFEHHLTPNMTLDDALKSLSILTNPINFRYEPKPEDPNNPAYG